MIKRIIKRETSKANPLQNNQPSLKSIVSHPTVSIKFKIIQHSSQQGNTFINTEKIVCIMHSDKSNHITLILLQKISIAL